MKLRSIAFFALGGILSAAPPAQQSVPVGQPATIAACLKAARDLQNARMKETGGAITAQRYRTIQEEKAGVARACAEQFAIDRVDPQELSSLAELYIEAAQPELADKAITRALAPGADPAARARTLVIATRLTMRQPISPERNARAERYVDELDGLPDALVREKIDGHGLLNSYYRADDIDAGIIKHSTRIIELGRQLEPEARVALGFQLIAAYENLAEAWAGHERTPEALDLLRRAPQDLAGVPGVEARLRPTLERYLLVGQAAAGIEAPQWLFADPDVKRMEMKGAVTYLQFTAHWCGPCRESYPGLLRLNERFATRGFRVVMATQLYGYFETRRNLTPAEERAAISEYFPKHGIRFPIAVSNNDPPALENGRPVRKVNVNDANYKVGGIPQIHIIDKKGIIRLIMVGYDEANEARLSGLIERLLAEPGT